MAIQAQSFRELMKAYQENKVQTHIKAKVDDDEQDGVRMAEQLRPEGQNPKPVDNERGNIEGGEKNEDEPGKAEDKREIREEEEMEVELGRPEKEKENEKVECDDLIMYGASEFEEEWKAAVMTVEGEGKVPVMEGKSQKAERNETTCTEVKKEKKPAQGKGESNGNSRRKKGK